MAIRPLAINFPQRADEIYAGLETPESYTTVPQGDAAIISDPPPDITGVYDFRDGHGPISYHRRDNGDGTFSGPIADSARIGKYTVIAPTAEVGPDCNIQASKVGGGTIIREDVTLEEGVYVSSHVKIGPRTTIGRGSMIGNGVTIEEDVVIGPNVELGERVMVGKKTRVLNPDPTKKFIIAAHIKLPSGITVTGSISSQGIGSQAELDRILAPGDGKKDLSRLSSEHYRRVKTPGMRK